MNFIIFISVLLVLSFIWALYTLIQEIKKPKEIEEARENLSKEKILYKA